MAAITSRSMVVLPVPGGPLTANRPEVPLSVRRIWFTANCWLKARGRSVPVNDANPRTGATRSNTKFQQRHGRFELHTELAQLAHDDFGRTLVRVGS
jgi:hypothetical protein